MSGRRSECDTSAATSGGAGPAVARAGSAHPAGIHVGGRGVKQDGGHRGPALTLAEAAGQVP
eukprot:15451192-Alexandrium_andersonii.AAC.1